MSSRSGKVEFKFEVERIFDKQEKKYLLLSKDLEDQIESDNEERYKYVFVELLVTGWGSYSPGRLHGLPEDCYPADSETDIENVVELSTGISFVDLLTSEEEDDIHQMIVEKVIEGEDDDYYYDEPDPYYDDYYYD